MNQQQLPGTPNHGTPQRRPRKFRWEWVWGVVAVLVCAHLLKNLAPSFEWGDLMEAAGVRNTARYSQLAVLGVALVAVVAIVRLVGRKNG